MSNERYIRYGDKTLPMPAEMTLEQAKAVMARHFPELAENPKVETKKDGDKTTYVFSKQAGRKGANAAPLPTPITALAALKPSAIVFPIHLALLNGESETVNATLDDVLNEELHRVERARRALLDVEPLPRTGGVLLL